MPRLESLMIIFSNTQFLLLPKRMPDERDESVQLATVKFSQRFAAMASSPAMILQSEMRAFLALMSRPSLFGMSGLFKTVMPLTSTFSHLLMLIVQLCESLIVTSRSKTFVPVSYTHLTLPTIYSV